jgi:hypothetical protein
MTNLRDTEVLGATATDKAPLRQEPIFLLAPARSYSTVMVAMISGHPDIYGFPEMLLSTAETVGGLIEQKPKPWQTPVDLECRRNGVLRAVADVHERSQEEPAMRNAEQWLRERSSWSPWQLMDHLLRAIYPQIGVEKSPETIASSTALDHCIGHYPSARFIHLTRHPASTMRSMQMHWRYRLINLSEKALVAHSAKAWYLGHSRIVRKLSELPAWQWKRVRAEDVLRAPDIWLPQLLDWLGLDSDDEIVSRMTRTENWQFAHTGRSGRLFGGDPKFMRAPVLRHVPEAGEIRFDPSWGLLDEMTEQMEALAQYLGY